MEDVYEIVLAGTGGQGLGLAGVILAQCFAEEEGKNVLETEAYAISQRGGFSRSEVLVSNGEINDVVVTGADILLALSQVAADAFIAKAKKSGVVLLDASYVRHIPQTEAKVFSLPFTEQAKSLGREGLANVIALGAISRITSLVSKASLEKTITNRFGSPMRDMNLRALDTGYELGETK